MTPHINMLREKVRYAIEPNNPQLICLWLKIEAEKTKNLSVEKQRSVYLKETRLLLDTLSDDLIPAHWRECCLNHIYQPLAYLHRLARNSRDLHHLNQLMHEVRVTSHFFNPANAIR